MFLRQLEFHELHKFHLCGKLNKRVKQTICIFRPYWKQQHHQITAHSSGKICQFNVEVFSFRLSESLHRFSTVKIKLVLISVLKNNYSWTYNFALTANVGNMVKTAKLNLKRICNDAAVANEAFTGIMFIISKFCGVICCNFLCKTCQ